VRVMTYNVRTGARDADGRDRLDAILAVVGEQAPDVLAVQELGRSNRAGRDLLRRIERGTGLRGHLARSWFGQPVALLVARRLRVLRHATLTGPFHHAALRLTVAAGDAPLTLVTTHLCPYSGWRRLWEARRLGTLARTGAPVLLMGDLNSLDPSGPHADELAALAPGYRSRHLRRGGGVDTRAVAALLAAGFTDLGAGVGGTVPTGLGGAEFGPMRLDYLLATAPVARWARDLRVVRDGPATTASDHYPLVADLDVPLA